MIYRLTGPIALLLVLGAPSARPGEESEPSPRVASIEELIRRLGDSSWQVREETQQALIARGSEAADPLARAIGSSDPEIALRARLILSQVNPLVVRVRIQRIEIEDPPRISEEAEGEVGEGAETQLPPRSDAGAYSVRCRVVGDRQVDLTVEQVIGGNRNLLQAPSSQEGAVSFIKRGEEGIYRQLGLHIDRERHPFVVVIRWWAVRTAALRGGAADPVPPRDLPALVRDLLIQAGAGEMSARLAALELLGLLRSKEAEGAFRAARAEPRLQAAALIGLAGLGDGKALDELEKLADLAASRPSGDISPEARGNKVRAQGLEALSGIHQPAAFLDGQSPESSWQNRAMLVLLQAGRESGFDSLARRISEIDSLAIHSALAELADGIDRANPASLDLLLDAVSSPEFLTQLIWEDPEIEHFYGVLLESAEGARHPQFIQRLLLGLSRTLGMDPWTTSGRHRIFARLWERIAQGAGDPEVLHDVLKEVLERSGSPSRLNEIVSWLGLCFRDEPMPEEGFEKVLLLLRGAVFKDAEMGPSIAVASNALSQLARTVAMTEPQLIALVKLLAEVAQAPKQPYASQFLQEVKRLTGIPAARARPGAAGAVQGPEESLSVQVERWAASAEETSAAVQRLFPSPAGPEGEALEYWEFDLLVIDPPREGPPVPGPSPVPPDRRVEVLDGHRMEARAGVPSKFTDRWGNRLSTRIEAEGAGSAGRYRLNGQASLELGLPSFIVSREKELRIGRYETSDIRLGTSYLSLPRGQRLLRMACLRAGGGAAPASLDPAELWRTFIAGLLETLSSRGGERAFQVIRELNLREAVPFLRKELEREDLKAAPRWDFPHGVARWLVERGDPAGRDYLLGELKAADVRRRIQAAQVLTGTGDPAGFRALLDLLEERPKELNPHVALSSLDGVLREKGLASEECREVLDLVMKDLQDPYFQSAGFSLLARITGNDFGYPEATRQAATPSSRKQAMARAVEAARSWWTARRGAPPPGEAPKK